MAGMVFWTVVIGVADTWIADGFRLDEGRLKDAIDEKMLAGCAHEGEIEVKVKRAPTEAALKRAEQRYEREE